MGEQLWLGRGHPRRLRTCPSWWWKLLQMPQQHQELGRKGKEGFKASHPSTFPGVGMLQSLLLLLLRVPGGELGQRGDLLPGSRQGCAGSGRVQLAVFVCAELPLVATGPRVSPGLAASPVPSASTPGAARWGWIWCGQGGWGCAVHSKGMLGRGRLVLWGQQGSAHTPQNL